MDSCAECAAIASMSWLPLSHYQVNVEVNVSGQLTEHLCMVNRGRIIPITQYLEENQVNAICHTFF
jgi:hypothetical protein